MDWNFQHVIEARHLRDYTIWVRFDDGREGDVDLTNELWGEAFESLKDVEVFKNFRIEYGTLVWSDQADIAPESLYEKVTATTASRPTRPV